MTTLSHQPARRLALPSLLGEDELVRTQVLSVLFSAITYVLYGAIAALQVAMGLMSPQVAAWLVAVSVGATWSSTPWCAAAGWSAGATPAWPAPSSSWASC
ncbi:hypothetical protein BurJ1DRAFT_0089 [Burkholderiales bacterium JOSHI_001]|nr:hypothetical protein BurJ1DRAFT_0089 [Burkholderiales bacterium JOSHI_001]